jgi:hypothetical protein
MNSKIKYSIDSILYTVFIGPSVEITVETFDAFTSPYSKNSIQGVSHSP